MRMMIIVAGFALAGCGGANPIAEGNTMAEPGAPSTGAAAAPVPKLPRVTMVEVNRLRIGMTYAEASALLGREGDPGPSKPGSQIYAWTNVDGSSLQATFRDGKLQGKLDFGIK